MKVVGQEGPEAMLDQISQIRLAVVHPSLAKIIATLDVALEVQGIQFRVVQGLRTLAEQAGLFAQGRTAPGHVVTYAGPGDSWHNYGVAVDLIPGLRDESGQAELPWEPNWEPQSPDFQAMIQAGIGLGLESGSSWSVARRDYPHFQLAGLPIAEPTAEMKDCLLHQGLEKFWEEFVE